MSNDPAPGGEQPGWHGQQPYPGAYGQPAEQPAYPGASYPPPGQQSGYGQPPPPWAQAPGQPGGQRWPVGASAGPAGLGGPDSGGPPPVNGAFSALFDFGFNSFATPVVIKILYVLGLVVIGLTYVGFVITAFAQSAGYGLLVLVLGGIAALFYVIFFRVFLEFYYAVVRMSEDIRAMRSRP